MACTSWTTRPQGAGFCPSGVRHQITGTGAVAGAGPKRLVQSCLDQQGTEDLFGSAVGQDPSLADVIKMVHPKPSTPQQEAVYGYLLGRPHEVTLLPPLIQQYEALKRGDTDMAPDVPFLKLTALTLTEDAWATIAERASWQTTRMNLNTFARHGVFFDHTWCRRLLRDCGILRRFATRRPSRISCWRPTQQQRTCCHTRFTRHYRTRRKLRLPMSRPVPGGFMSVWMSQARWQRR